MATSSDSIRNAAPPALKPWLVLALGLLLCSAVAREGSEMILAHWLIRPEYSHGILIPFLSAYLVWRRRDLFGDRFAGAWLGVVIVAASLLLWLLGRLSTISTLTQYALLFMVYGVFISCVGSRTFAKLWAPMLMLFLAIPLPSFLYNNLSSELQLVSSSLGVAMLRLCGISVYLSGNVIDLGHFQMQVVEACDGLRYLFPLMTLGFVVACFFQAPLWQRVLVFVSSVPITIGMNSLRIAMIGIFADFGNTSLAEGLLHELQGWVIFMASGALLLAEVWLLVRLTVPRTDWRLALGLGAGAGARSARAPTNVPSSLLCAAAVLGIAATLSYFVPERAEATPQRRWFVDFPPAVADWHGRQGRIDDQYLDILALDDYLIADFSDGANAVNLYAAYYESQRDTESVHSPRSCIPGGGWRITEFSKATVARGGAEGFEVNRALIELGDQRQLVYYWFKQRERELTSEYAVKWYIFVDSLLERRSDGALVRLTTPLLPGDDIVRAEARLQEFALAARAELRPFLPD
jgi:exosortase D (VPLPA-CTERM-specific)